MCERCDEIKELREMADDIEADGDPLSRQGQVQVLRQLADVLEVQHDYGIERDLND